MLKFIFGRACSGKTSTLFELLKQNVKTKSETILLVPEQFSFETEKAVLKLFGDKDASKVQVLTFSRLYDEVTRELGGGASAQLTDFAKHILLNRALKESAEELKLWKRYVNHQGFVSSLLDSIEEFKLNFISPEDLFGASERLKSGTLPAKLNDLATVYNRYNMLIGEKFIDPSDKITKLYYLLAESGILRNKTVFIDGFKSFTGQQYRILERIFADSDDIYVSLTNYCEKVSRYDTFENVRETVQRLKNLAKSHGVDCCEDIRLTGNHFVGKDIAKVEKILALQECEETESDGSVCVCEAETIYDEAQFVAHTIRKLVRTKNYRFRDFVIIARDIEPFEEAVISACERNEVKCFSDKRRTLANYPTARCILAAFNAINGFKTQEIFNFLKSGLNILSTEELCELENYTRLWNINSKQWFSNWDMNPDGFVLGETQKEDARLVYINELRSRAINPLIEFKNNFKGNAKSRISAIIKLLEETSAKQSFWGLYQELKDREDAAGADALRQSWDVLIGIFNSFIDCCGQEDMNADEFSNAFKLAVFGADIGVSPQTLDEVSFGSADRIRPSRPKVAFIIGANQGVFPANLSASGLFAATEREKLIGCGIEIPDRSINSAIDEEFLVYSNVCCATERLYISYSKIDAEQNECECSDFVSKILAGVNCGKEYSPNRDSVQIPETAAAAFTAGCANFARNPQISGQLFRAIGSQYENNVNQIKNCNNVVSQRIEKGTAEKLFGKELRISASKLDTYKRCKFQYFCRYGLNARKLQPADFDVLQRGTLIHFCLQCYFEEYGKQIAQLTDDEVKCAAKRYIDKYLSCVPGFYSIIDARIKFLLSNMSRSMSEVMIQLRNEFAQSSFEPKHCEFEFGMGESPEVKIDFEGGQIKLNGSIDRVDTWNGYVRIVDYKSGSRSFKLPDILVGQNMQMLLYLFALKRIDSFSALKPAGIFYMPAKRDKDGTGLAMNGLMVADEDLIKAMDKENSGEFVPNLKITSKGEISKMSASSFVSQQDFESIFDYIERLLKHTGSSILSGDIAINPVDGLDSPACKYCDFSAVCSMSENEHEKAQKMTNEEVMTKINEEAQSSEI